MKNKCKIAILGSPGFIGRHLTTYLINKGYDVWTLDNFVESCQEWTVNPEKHFNVDIRDREKIDQIFKDNKFDYVYHCAAFASEALSAWMARYCMEVNLIGTINIINACVKYGVRKLISFSSVAIYGEGSLPPPFNEKQTPLPSDFYGISKLAGETSLTVAKDFFDLDYSIVRAHNVIGTHQALHNPYRNAVSIFINQALNKLPITVYGSGEATRAFSDVAYILEPLEKLMTQGNGEIFNLGADKTYKILDLAHIVKRIAERHGYKTSVIHLPARKEVKIAHCDHSKAKDMLGFKDETNLIHTIEEMFLWAEQEPKREPVSYNYELDKNIYDFWKK